MAIQNQNPQKKLISTESNDLDMQYENVRRDRQSGQEPPFQRMEANRNDNDIEPLGGLGEKAMGKQRKPESPSRK